MKIFRKMHCYLFALCVVASLSSTGLAQQAASPEMPTAKDLSFLIGKWETSIAVKATGITPKEITGKGIAEYRLFGQAIEGSRASDTSNGHFEDREFIVYTSDQNAYLWFTLNINGTLTQRTLSRKGDLWVVQYGGQMNGKNFTARGTYKIISANELHYTSEVDVENSGLKPFSEVIITRAPEK